MIGTESPPSGGLLHSVRGFFDGLLASAQARFELLSTEFLEEKYRLIQSCFWVLSVFFAGALAVAFGSLTLVLACPARLRLWVLGGLTLAYFGVFIATLLGFRRHLARQPRPFAETLQEWEEDRACIRSGN